MKTIFLIMINNPRKTFLVIVLFAVAIVFTAQKYETNQKTRIEHTLGQTVIIQKQPLLITNYLPISNKYLLSNGQQISPALAEISLVQAKQ